MYHSGSRPSGSTHRPKEIGGLGPRSSRNSCTSSGPARRPSPSPSGSCSSRTHTRRPRSPSGPRGRRPSPSPPRGRRVSRSPPRGRRLSPSPPRGRRGSPSPPRSRRLFPPGPAGFRGASRGDSRERSGDSGSRRHSPGLPSDSLEQSLRITVGNDHFSASIPERRCLSTRRGSSVDSLEHVDREERPLSSFLGQLDEDYRTNETFLHRSDYGSRISDHDELSWGTEWNRDKSKGSYYTRSEERGREAKRPRYDDAERLQSMADDQPAFTSGTRNYRQRRRSPSPRFLDPEFQELDLARRKREEEEQSRSMNQLLGVDDGGTSCSIPGLSSVHPSSKPGYSLHRPKEVSVMPKKSILKKRIDVNMESSMQHERFPSNTSSSQDHSLYSGLPSYPTSDAVAAFSSEIENSLGDRVEAPLTEPQGNRYQWGSLSGQTKDRSPLREKFGSFLGHKDKSAKKTEGPDQHTDFLLPHERANQDGGGFSRILSMLADSTSTQEKRRRSFPDIEDEEKFLYGDEEDLKAESVPKTLGGSDNEVLRKKTSSLPSSTVAIKRESIEEPNPEYSKIHDLLKTIGLDIGAAEIGKLAVRTQERLHGKKPVRSSADRRASAEKNYSSDQYSSADQRFSADRCTSDLHTQENQEEHYSSTHSSEVSHPHPVSPVDPYLLTKNNPPFLKSDQSVGHSAGTELVGSRFQSPVAVRCMLPSAPRAPVRHRALSQFHLPRASQFAATLIPSNYQGSGISPVSFDAYRHYMAYAASRWPVYPTSQPSSHPLSEPHRVIPIAKQARSRPNLRVIPTVASSKSRHEATALVSVPTIQEASQESISSHIKYNPEKISDEKNRASQKQKVIEEREKLKSDREARQKKMFYLRTELERLHKQQGEMLRKKRREKDGHKDPLLMEVSRLQDNIMKDMAELRQEAEEAEKKQSELDKVAQILGINILDKPGKSNDSKEPAEKPGKGESSKSPEEASSSDSSFSNKKSKENEMCPQAPENPPSAAAQTDQPVSVYEYYDAGSHWCKECNAICGTMFDFFTHMHNKKHTKTLDPYHRPWASKTQSNAKQDTVKRTDKITVPAKGSEFLIPITGYYCQLCEEYFGDAISGEQHVKGHQHNEKYKEHIDENPLYEERRNLDRQAGLAVALETERRRQSELKHKLSEKSKEENKEKKAKLKKETEEDIDIKITEELEDSFSEDLNSPEKAENERNDALKLQSKEKVKKGSPSSSLLGKFSWKKPEKEEEKNSVVAPIVPKEETLENNTKEKEESKAEAGKTKPIKIKLSGKTVVTHTSSWTPVVTTSTQTKIRPNLPIPSTVFRKSGSATVNKPAPLNTFLSIKSSGTTTKPLPVVKESPTDLHLPPDIISKAFGGEEVILKGSEEKMVVTEKVPAHVPEQMIPPPPPPPPPPTVPHPATPSPSTVKSEAAVSHTVNPNFLSLNILNPVMPVAILASEQPAAIPSDETAPGVSENDHDRTLLSVLVRPPPPLSGVFSEQAKKLEKRNSCLATANAKDLYDIFYSSGGKGAPETKVSGGSVANGENSNFSKAENSEMSSTSTVNSSASQEKFPLGTSVVSVPLASNSEKLIANPSVSLGKWSVVECINSECKDNCSFLQPLTRLYQSKPSETLTPKADNLARWPFSTSQRDADKCTSSEGRNYLDLGEPSPPGVEPNELSDICCHTRDSQKRVEAHFVESDSQDGENREFQQSKECGECVADTNTEPKERGSKLSERIIGEGTRVTVGPSSTDNSNLECRNKNKQETEVEQPKLQLTDKTSEQSRKIMAGSEIQNKVVTELSSQTFSSIEAKVDAYQSDTMSFLKTPPGKSVKFSAPEFLSHTSAISDMYLTNSAQKQEDLADSEERIGSSSSESGSKTYRNRNLNLKRERSKAFRGKKIHKMAVRHESKKPEIWENIEKSEAEVLELQDVCSELTVTVEKKALEDFEVVNLKVEEITAVGNLGDMGAGFCNAQAGTTHRSPVALVQKVCEENSLSPVGCSPTILGDFEPISYFSESPLDSPKTLVHNFGVKGIQSSSNSRSGRVTHNILKTVLPLENVDLGLENLERTHQALDLLSGGMMSEGDETQLEKQDPLRLESEMVNSAGLGPSPCLPDLVDFVTRTSGVQKEMGSPFSEPGDAPECTSLDMVEPLQLEELNASITDSHPQVDEGNSNTLTLVKPLVSKSPQREHVVRDIVIPQEIIAQEAAIDAIQDTSEFTIQD